MTLFKNKHNLFIGTFCLDFILIDKMFASRIVQKSKLVIGEVCFFNIVLFLSFNGQVDVRPLGHPQFFSSLNFQLKLRGKGDGKYVQPLSVFATSVGKLLY